MPQDTTNRHPSTELALRPFVYGHLPEHLQRISKPFCDLAYQLVEWLPDDPELTTALQKLREAKDRAVSCKVFHPDS